MSRKKKHSGKSAFPRSRTAGEDRGSVALTVVWMLTALATAAAVAVVLVARLLLWQFPPDSSGASPLRIVPELFLMVATITGLLCLVLTPVVYRARRDPPPRSIATTAVVVSVLPLALAIWQAMSA